MREHPERVKQVRVVRLRHLPKRLQGLLAEVDSVGVLLALVERVRQVERRPELFIQRTLCLIVKLRRELLSSGVFQYKIHHFQYKIHNLLYETSAAQAIGGQNGPRIPVLLG